MSGFADLYLAIYPTVVLARLQITLKKKLALCTALGLGAVWVLPGGCRTRFILTYIGRVRWLLSSAFSCQVYTIRRTQHGSKACPQIMSPSLLT
jgi:hypothetical protein